jgi:hypothetical protein
LLLFAFGNHFHIPDAFWNVDPDASAGGKFGQIFRGNMAVVESASAPDVIHVVVGKAHHQGLVGPFPDKPFWTAPYSFSS